MEWKRISVKLTFKIIDLHWIVGKKEILICVSNLTLCKIKLSFWDSLILESFVFSPASLFDREVSVVSSSPSPNLNLTSGYLLFSSPSPSSASRAWRQFAPTDKAAVPLSEATLLSGIASEKKRNQNHYINLTIIIFTINLIFTITIILIKLSLQPRFSLTQLRCKTAKASRRDSRQDRGKQTKI